MNKTEALKLALEALERYETKRQDDRFVELITAINEALAQPQREWVGLTYKEIMKIDSTYYRPMGPLEFSKLLEDKLKEKNYDDRKT